MTIFGAEDGDRLKRYREEGVERAVVILRSAGSEAVLPILDRRAALIRALGA